MRVDTAASKGQVAPQETMEVKLCLAQKCKISLAFALAAKVLEDMEVDASRQKKRANN